MIGIRLADHSLYPVYEAEVPGRKRMVLTTAYPGQKRASIDLFRFPDSSTQSPEELAHLELDGIESVAAGDAELELDTVLDKEGNFQATITDRVTGTSRSTSVPGAIYSIEESLLLSEPVAEPDEVSPNRNRGVQWMLAAAAVVAVVIAGLVIARGIRSEPTDQTPISATESQDATAPQSPATDDAQAATGDSAETGAAGDSTETGPAQPADTDGTRSADTGRAGEGASSEAADSAQGETAATTDNEQTKPLRNGRSDEPGTIPDTVAAAPGPDTEYRIIWGDTLWDISEAFYGTPWLYRKIAEENEIRNPDLIYANDQITIPGRE